MGIRNDLTRKIRQIEYRHGMLKPDMKPSDLPLNIWQDSEISSEIRKAIEDENLQTLGGVYGDETIGSPVEYDYLRIVLENDIVEIEFFNRGITLIFTDDEIAKRIHRVICKLDKK